MFVYHFNLSIDKGNAVVPSLPLLPPPYDPKGMIYPQIFEITEKLLIFLCHVSDPLAESLMNIRTLQGVYEFLPCVGPLDFTLYI